MEEMMKAFMEQSRRVRALTATSFLLQWDQETVMPPGGADDRGEQGAVLDAMIHEILASDELAEMLEVLEPYAAKELSFDSTEAGLIRHMAYRHRLETRIPTRLVDELGKLTPVAIEAWREARANNDFAKFEPHLQQMFDLWGEAGGYLTDTGNPYDGLIHKNEQGMTSDSISEIFNAVRPRLVDLVKAIAANQGAVDGSLVRREVPREKQLAFGREVAEAVGYDFHRGRLDTVTHPFAWGTGKGDSRITTKVVLNDPMWCIQGVMHESGHAMHLQNMGDDLARTAMAVYPSAAIGESQSRLIENMVGRSRAFWEAYYPRLQKAFAPTFDDLKLDDFYKSFHESKPSLIRIEADEVTYGLHIMLRHDLENDVINGRVKVKDLPKEWNARMEAYLGLVPPTDSDGVLQDIHWAFGSIGYFAGYLLGSMFSAQLWNELKKDIPDIDDQLRSGKADGVLPWTAEKVMRHGSKYNFKEMTDRTVGGFDPEPYIEYLTGKYGEIYGL